ncbi:hypothetical protein TNCV_2606331 [Trichonephila clavipes]|nr:hypothetical protein TNCV_2606331 [Trichonephila clavipes]
MTRRKLNVRAVRASIITSLVIRGYFHPFKMPDALMVETTLLQLRYMKYFLTGWEVCLRLAVPLASARIRLYLRHVCFKKLQFCKALHIRGRIDVQKPERRRQCRVTTRRLDGCARGRGLSLVGRNVSKRRMISENELDGGELSCSNLDSDEDIKLSESDCKESEETANITDGIPVFCDKAVVQQACSKHKLNISFYDIKGHKIC